MMMMMMMIIIIITIIIITNVTQVEDLIIVALFAPQFIIIISFSK